MSAWPDAPVGGPQPADPRRAPCRPRRHRSVEVAAFNAEFDAATFGAEQARVVAKYRTTIVLATRPEVAAAIAACLAGTSEACSVAEQHTYLRQHGPAA
ncbi:hypothetical protein ABT127_30125 [Streptomyces sp. NPDC001904]|uniref:hypothetical protein n=1 Tax=Streptomyces sp. NPDC001904 TaxID=3154531 RepID=UPI0033291571